MDTAEIIGAIFGTICFLVWIPCLISWIRQGVSIPHYINIIAFGATCVGLGLMIGLAIAGICTLTLGIALVGIPPAPCPAVNHKELLIPVPLD